MTEQTFIELFIERFYSNLVNGIETMIKEDHITLDSSVAELLDKATTFSLDSTKYLHKKKGR